MIPRIHRGGRSVRGALAYVMHDAREDPSQAHPTTTKRVAWTHTVNVPTDDVDLAGRIMAGTIKDAPTRKAITGISAGGRKLRQPIMHYSLAWPPDQTPTREEMTEAAETSLRALTLEDCQAVIVAHTDTDHAHVHVLVNRVSAQDGRAADVNAPKLRLSGWARQWEGQHTIDVIGRFDRDKWRKMTREERQLDIEQTRQYERDCLDEGHTPPTRKEQQPTRGAGRQERTDQERAEWSVQFQRQRDAGPGIDLDKAAVERVKLSRRQERRRQLAAQAERAAAVLRSTAERLGDLVDHGRNWLEVRRREKAERRREAPAPPRPTSSSGAGFAMRLVTRLAQKLERIAPSTPTTETRPSAIEEHTPARRTDQARPVRVPLPDVAPAPQQPAPRKRPEHDQPRARDR